MATNLAPAGWYFETGDPSVGLFGGGWVHEDCPAADEYELLDAECLPLATWVKPTGEATFWYLVTCLDCAQQRVVLDYDYVGPPDDDEPLYTLSQV